ncbi:MAG: YeeE/YedE family protein [Hyphomicrobiales bacterium]
MKLVLSYIIGLIFGIGIVISGMANPAKVINFFDFAGNWDASLAFVMAGGLIITFIGYRFILAKPAPLLEAKFDLPSKTSIDFNLIGGSALFGIGWGIAGFCPGGAIPALGTGMSQVFIFTAAMVAGIYATKFVQKTIKSGFATKIANTP